MPSYPIPIPPSARYKTKVQALRQKYAMVNFFPERPGLTEAHLDRNRTCYNRMIKDLKVEVNSSISLFFDRTFFYNLMLRKCKIQLLSKHNTYRNKRRKQKMKRILALIIISILSLSMFVALAPKGKAVPRALIQSDWNRTLNSTEMANPDLVGYWRFDEGSGLTSHDYSIYHDDASLASAPNTPQWVSPGAPIFGVHDVAVTPVVHGCSFCPLYSCYAFAPDVGRGFSDIINVTVSNKGSFTETFGVTFYANASAITTQTVTLAVGASTTLTLNWNTTGFALGNYTISVDVALAPGETNSWTDPFTYGTVRITKVGDLGGGVPPQFFKFDCSYDATTEQRLRTPCTLAT
jgi:hypothetical protein